MLTFEQIKSFFPKKEQSFQENIVREYLQYLILDAIFSSNFGARMKFIGGTCLRILYGGDRFSQDLDFDNDGLSLKDFRKLSKLVKTSLEQEGFMVEIKIVSKGAFRCVIKFPGLMFDYGLTTNKKQKMAIFIDTTHQTFKSVAKTVIINKFGVYREIRTQPLDILLSQKINAFLGRSRMKGRDIYDIVHLWPRTEPNFKYLASHQKTIKDINSLLNAMRKKLVGKEMKALLADVRPFLPDKKKILEVEMFDRWLEQIENEAHHQQKSK